MSELPPLVDATWLQEHLAEDDLLVGDVRGPNAHQRGHLPRSIPLVLGSPPPLATRETVQEFAVEVQRRLGRHGVTGELEQGAVELQKTKTSLQPRLDAVPTWEELRDRLADEGLTILDVRTDEEFSGRGGYPCDPRQGHIPGAGHLVVDRLFAAPGRPHEPWGIRELVGLPEGAEIVVYCHSGSRSALAALALRAAGYDARNYPGSWHEWSRHEELPAER